MKVPFGRFRNFELTQVPVDYLRFLRRLEIRNPYLRAAIEAEAERRGLLGDRDPESHEDGVDTPGSCEVVA